MKKPKYLAWFNDKVSKYDSYFNCDISKVVAMKETFFFH